MEPLGKCPERPKKPGRPRAIPAKLEAAVVELYRRGYGYRKISNILESEYQIASHYTTVKKLLCRLGVLTHTDNPSQPFSQIGPI